MMKKFLTYPVFLVLFLSFIGSMLFGTLLRHHYLGGERFLSLQKIAVIIAEVPITLSQIIKKRNIKSDVIMPINDIVYENTKVFEKKLNYNVPTENLILITRYDGDLGRSIVEIRDINNFEVLHSYKPNVEEFFNKIDLTKDEFKYLKRNRGGNVFFLGTLQLLIRVN